jgi:hypothetical protein
MGDLVCEEKGGVWGGISKSPVHFELHQSLLCGPGVTEGADKPEKGAGPAAPRWFPLPPGTTKINVDAALSKNSKRASMASIARNDAGAFLGASTMVMAGVWMIQRFWRRWVQRGYDFGCWFIFAPSQASERLCQCNQEHQHKWGSHSIWPGGERDQDNQGGVWVFWFCSWGSEMHMILLEALCTPVRGGMFG